MTIFLVASAKKYTHKANWYPLSRSHLTHGFVRFRCTLAGVKTTIIYPATDNHIVKHSTQEVFIFDESPTDYADKTLPYLEAGQFSLDVSDVSSAWGELCCVEQCFLVYARSQTLD